VQALQGGPALSREEARPPAEMRFEEEPTQSMNMSQGGPLKGTSRPLDLSLMPSASTYYDIFKWQRLNDYRLVLKLLNDKFIPSLLIKLKAHVGFVKDR
jgi:hypothetical protein